MVSLNKAIAKFSINLIAFIAGIFLVISLYKSPTKNDINSLKKDNEALLLQNSILAKKNDSLQNNIESSNLIISELNRKDSTFKIKIGKLNTKIEYVKQEYEKANNHANNFNSLDIQRYFAELK